MDRIEQNYFIQFKSHNLLEHYTFTVNGQNKVKFAVYKSIEWRKSQNIISSFNIRKRILVGYQNCNKKYMITFWEKWKFE